LWKSPAGSCPDARDDAGLSFELLLGLPRELGPRNMLIPCENNLLVWRNGEPTTGGSDRRQRDVAQARAADEAAGHVIRPVMNTFGVSSITDTGRHESSHRAPGSAGSSDGFRSNAAGLTAGGDPTFAEACGSDRRLSIEFRAATPSCSNRPACSANAVADAARRDRAITPSRSLAIFAATGDDHPRRDQQVGAPEAAGLIALGRTDRFSSLPDRRSGATPTVLGFTRRDRR